MSKEKYINEESKSGETNTYSRGLFKFGIFLTITGALLLALRLLLGEHSVLGIVSNLLIIVSGAYIAWKPFLNYRK
ncbi:hypothetical protein H924_13340 (plasmid) [Corynebacterium callunae DSM 20147]|uniref:Uncharacterized protein n=1 Tax=Corynebacterium callunae DSM 20147 TaxID=1121353 RepID=M1UWJ1_9CORY|nr:hypothetical protein H924_13340 [Corynebacterium callunae DSM 20147]